MRHSPRMTENTTTAMTAKKIALTIQAASTNGDPNPADGVTVVGEPELFQWARRLRVTFPHAGPSNARVTGQGSALHRVQAPLAGDALQLVLAALLE
jgi:hypothetical protein